MNDELDKINNEVLNETNRRIQASTVSHVAGTSASNPYSGPFGTTWVNPVPEYVTAHEREMKLILDAIACMASTILGVSVDRNRNDNPKFIDLISDVVKLFESMSKVQQKEFLSNNPKVVDYLKFVNEESKKIVDAFSATQKL